MCQFSPPRTREVLLTLLASWIALPSARGSVKGIPSSITSAPPASMASMRGTVAAGEGKPAVRKVTKTGAFCWSGSPSQPGSMGGGGHNTHDGCLGGKDLLEMSGHAELVVLVLVRWCGWPAAVRGCCERESSEGGNCPAKSKTSGLEGRTNWLGRAIKAYAPGRSTPSTGEGGRCRFRAAAQVGNRVMQKQGKKGRENARPRERVWGPGVPSDFCRARGDKVESDGTQLKYMLL